MSTVKINPKILYKKLDGLECILQDVQAMISAVVPNNKSVPLIIDEKKEFDDKRKQRLCSLTMPHLLVCCKDREAALEIINNEWNIMTEDQRNDFLEL